MTEPLVYLDGRFRVQSEATLTLHDAGFVMGATVTDLCRTFRHKLYRWRDHLTRFQESCARTSIPLPLSAEEITTRAAELVEHNARLLKPDMDLALVLFATPGPIGYYRGESGGAGEGPVTFGMHTFPLPFGRYRRLITEGAALMVPRVRQLPRDCIDPRVKMRSRLHWWLADQEARRLDPGAMALLLDGDGHVTETAAANVLIVKHGVVLSPPRERILNGISLRVFAELCDQLGIAFAERALTPQDLLSAEEVMLTSTPYCVAGVSRLNGMPIPWPGAIFRRLLQSWSDGVGVDIHSQIMGK